MLSEADYLMVLYFFTCTYPNQQKEGPPSSFRIDLHLPPCLHLYINPGMITVSHLSFAKSFFPISEAAQIIP